MPLFITPGEEVAEENHMHRANSTYIAKGDKELTVFEGDTLRPLNAEPRPDWALVEEMSSGNIGIVPIEICETPEERDARINADFNTNISDEIVRGGPVRKASNNKRVSFIEEPHVIPIQEPNGPEIQSPQDEGSLLKEREFENQLNLQEILSAPIEMQKGPEGNEKIKVRIYKGNINGPVNLAYKTILTSEDQSLLQIEQLALIDYEISYGKLELVHAENSEKLVLPLEFSLLQASLLAKKATRIFSETKDKEQARIKIKALIEESEKKGFTSLTVEKTTKNMDSKFRLVMNTDPQKTNAFNLQIFDKKEKKPKRLTVEYQDKLADIVSIMFPKAKNIKAFGSMMGKELSINLNHTITDVMNLFDCGPACHLDTEAFVLVVDVR